MIKRVFRTAPPALVSPKIWVQQALFWAGAVVVALTAILFAKASTLGNGLFASIMQIHPLLAFIIIPPGFAGLVWLTRRFFTGGEGSGIPQTIVALDSPEITDRASILSLRIAFGKIVLTSLGLCVGASIGREGPTVQIGAALMHKFGKWLRLSDPKIRRALILAGGAAGISAAFNTPLAGLLFAIEELSRSFEERTSGTAITAVIVAGVVSMAVLGNYTYFGHTGVSLELDQAWAPVLVCGIVGGLLGGLFSRLILYFAGTVPGRLGELMAQRPVLFAACCGFFLALLGQFCDHTVFGTGYEEARGLIEGTRELPKSFGFMKLIATAVSYISGLPGGLFAPSLAVGAGLGANLSPFFPDVPASAIVILGLAGYFTGVVQVPITATIIVMEMIDNQSLTLPLMATAFIAFAFSRIVCPTPIYRTLATLFLERTKRRLDQTSPTTAKEPETQPVPSSATDLPAGNDRTPV